MQRCQFVKDCAFYQERLAEMPPEAGFLKSLYCHKLWEKCQRFKHSDEIPVSEPANDLPPLIMYARK